MGVKDLFFPILLCVQHEFVLQNFYDLKTKSYCVCVI
jgi:hypothetical protein